MGGRLRPLHWAAYHGNAFMARIILGYAPDLEAADDDFQGTPFAWALHGAEHGWYRDTGDYTGTVEVLLDAGVKVSKRDQMSANETVRAVLRARGIGS